MTLYEYIGSNDHYLDGGDTKLTPGDEVELDESDISFEEYYREIPEKSGEENSSGEEDDSPADGEETAESENEGAENESEEEVADPPINPSEFTVKELESELESGDFSDDELKAIEIAESSGEGRTSALEAISEEQ